MNTVAAKHNTLHQFRIRKMRNKDQYAVTEWYAGHRIMLVEDQLSHNDAIKVATECADAY